MMSSLSSRGLRDTGGRAHGVSRGLSRRGLNQTICMSTVTRNANIGKLQAGYLFPEIARRRNEHLEANPDAKIISLGIGDTTEPIPQPIVNGMVESAKGLGTLDGYGKYGGYGAEQGQGPLREAIAERFYSHVDTGAADIFVSDGSKCDIGRIQMMFGSGHSVSVQDPSYPAYVDTSVIIGNTGLFNDDTSQFNDIQYMACTAGNGFFPDIDSAKKTDLVFFCSPNNPTGAAATREQLTKLVAKCKADGSILIYDAAYAIYIENPDCPKTIYEIPGADEVAIETCSFSKYAGFTGLRLGWTVVPENLTFSDGSKVKTDYNRIMTTCFNGASNVAQAAGMACCSDAGYKSMLDLVAYYKENALILKKCFEELGFEVYGGTDAPYVWVGFPGKNSWDVFAEILSGTSIVTTPGAGFGPAGEGFVRASAFGHRENILEAVDRLKDFFKK
uniref:Aminotransferase class I/classII large domain-containing protein n=1 Tax=Pycnococcus provasolii TaxID=41880 RepID=A0A7S2AUR3_9CHLO|mmetsp:Transcript_2857/g.6364  ORF Transcript_2857/g.6364 Transcript_2857/m.6364 type:complete len:446 (+) Transcript_2857:75-1412(+)